MVAAVAPVPASAFAGLLRQWRRQRRLSQLQLSLEAGISQRHLSFLESGRARPSRGMILRLSEVLELPLRDRNDWLLQAGFAPAYRDRPLEDPAMAAVMAAVEAMLANHAPFPAVAVDRAWNVRRANAPFQALLAAIGQPSAPAPNLMRLFFAPDGLGPMVANRAMVAPLLWHRARREADALNGAEMRALLAELEPWQDRATLAAPPGLVLQPVVPLELALGDRSLALFSVITTFGTPQDVTTDELRIESFFPANAATDAHFRSAAGQ
jgi:transcriptional regulator with XRE-family HTH domain